MKPQNSQPNDNCSVKTNNRFSFLLLTVDLVLTASVFIFFVWQVYHSIEVKNSIPEQMLFAYDYFSLSVVSIVLILVVSIIAWWSTVRSLYNSQKNFLINNGEKQRVEEELKVSEEKFRELFENANDLIYTTDLQGNFTSLNNIGEKITGYTREEAAEMNLSDVVAPDFVEYARRMLALKLKEEVPTTYEIEIVTKQNNRVALEISNRLIYKNGEAAGVQGIARDVTSRKQTAKALKESEQLYRLLSEGILHQVWTARPDGRLDYVNGRTLEYFGLTKERIIGENWLDVIHPDDVPNCIEQWNKSLQTGGYYEVEFRLKRADGEYRWHAARATAGRDGNGKIIKWFGTNTDINDQNLAENSVRDSEAQMRALFSAMQDAVLVLDDEGRYLEVAPTNPTLLYKSGDEMLGKRMHDVLSPNQADAFLDCIHQSLDTKQPVSIEYPLAINNRELWFAAIISPLTEKSVLWVARDITERKRAEGKIKESEANLAAAQRITHLGSWELYLTDSEDAKKDDVRWSDEVFRIFGYEPGECEVSGELVYGCVHPDDRARISEAIFEAVERRKEFNIEHRIVLPDGSERIVQGRAELVFDEFSGEPLKLVGTVQDISERKKSDAALRESEYKFRTLLESMSEGLLQADTDEVIEFVNNRFCEMTGFTSEELLGKTMFDLMEDDEGREYISKANRQRREGLPGHYEVRMKKKSNETLWVLIGGAPIVNADGVVTGSMGVFTDITERKLAEQQLLHDAFHDALTGLANRTLFMDHLQQTIKRGKRKKGRVYAVLFLDFDRFKVINDSLGHAEGDSLLKQIGQRLEDSMRLGDLVARLGGDEFTILLDELNDTDDALQIAERIQTDLKTPFILNDREIFITASIGIAHSTAGHISAEDMLRDADLAMYSAKAKGKAQYQVFDQSMHASALTKLQFETEMRQALQRGEFYIAYQPIMELAGNNLAGFEALVRWNHPERGTVSPGEFIPVAEESGLVIPLGRWILYESCRQMREWQKNNPEAMSLKVSVNLSTKQFSQPDLVEQVTAALISTQLDPHCLKLEITESQVMENSDKAVTMMNRLRALGIEISLDDFGTGYSSLSYLHRLPVNYLKIDRSFVSRMVESKENGEIVHTIIKLAQNLKMRVVAEGIETAEQLAQLKRLNCELGQGYFFSKPIEAADVESFIEKNRKEAKDSAFVLDEQIINLELNM